MSVASQTQAAIDLVVGELSALLHTVSSRGDGAVEELSSVLRAADRLFVLGLGRSGLALRMLAMRLMHLGLAVHVVGEVTTPAIAAGDVLLVASGSGTTPTVVRAAETATAVGAHVVALTAAESSPLTAIAAASVVLPAAGKLDRSGQASAQYAGSLFEQGVVAVGDALFHAMWQAGGATADDLWPRHANLE